MERLRRAIEDYLHELDAAHALTCGVDSEALAELAGLSKDSVYKIRELVPTVVEELSIDVAALPESVFRKSGEAAREYLTGDLGFRPAVRQAIGLMFDRDYLAFDVRPDVGINQFNDLWLLNEWIYAVDNGHERDGVYYFETSENAEASFNAGATVFAAPRTLVRKGKPPLLDCRRHVLWQSCPQFRQRPE
ncbi:hypothetical protein [Natronoglycomyces albus]|uniref:Uncharacterized protein n=1 Tax=Natronoglycomyces albus TaxID=2811108 RepID=A0A895XLX4_9ACTN|nr:hypothetical protein [Natronoglycomyces albus]QSB06097.1 hypothetical protein JQS30_04040 [Natronoglycomyces albus]